MNELLTAAQVSRRLDAPHNRLLRKIASGEITPSYRAGATLLFASDRLAEIGQIIARKN